MGEARLAHQSPVGQQGLDTVAAEGEDRVAAEREGGAVGPQQQVGLAAPRVDGEYARGTGADQVSIVQRADVADDQGAEGTLADCISQEAWSACIVSLGERRKRPLLVAT